MQIDENFQEFLHREKKRMIANTVLVHIERS